MLPGLDAAIAFTAQGGEQQKTYAEGTDAAGSLHGQAASVQDADPGREKDAS